MTPHRTSNPFLSRMNIASSIPSSSRYHDYQSVLYHTALSRVLDRVGVLGEEGPGHTGCVNALSWSSDGDVLLSGSDDTTIKLWKTDPDRSDSAFAMKCCATIHTGHTDNIFNAKLLPSSTKMATVARDGEVRVFDVRGPLGASPRGAHLEFGTRATGARVFRCHLREAKRICAEEASDTFLTVGGDGTVRQHDLRQPHRCPGSCPSPLVRLPFPLSNISSSPIVPYQFVICGDSPCGYLFDRRQLGRFIRDEWGIPCSTDEYTTCVRRFSRRAKRTRREKLCDHITGCRMAQSNGHEVLLSYSIDDVYLFSTRSETVVAERVRKALLHPNAGRKKRKLLNRDYYSDEPQSSKSRSKTRAHSASQAEDGSGDSSRSDSEDDKNPSDDSIASGESTTPQMFRAPVVRGIGRYKGAINVETYKDGCNDEFIASGSDDGNFFMWHKESRKLCGIYGGDSAIVNVIEGHPKLPVVAVSGIDNTVKLFAPTTGHSAFSHMDEVEEITSSNQENIRVTRQVSLIGYLHRRAINLDLRLDGDGHSSEPDENGDEDDDDDYPPCRHQ